MRWVGRKRKKKMSSSPLPPSHHPLPPYLFGNSSFAACNMKTTGDRHNTAYFRLVTSDTIRLHKSLVMFWCKRLGKIKIQFIQTNTSGCSVSLTFQHNNMSTRKPTTFHLRRDIFIFAVSRSAEISDVSREILWFG